MQLGTGIVEVYVPRWMSPALVYTDYLFQLHIIMQIMPEVFIFVWLVPVWGSEKKTT